MGRAPTGLRGELNVATRLIMFIVIIRSRFGIFVSGLVKLRFLGFSFVDRFYLLYCICLG